jgi:hypothetical protein
MTDEGTPALAQERLTYTRSRSRTPYPLVDLERGMYIALAVLALGVRLAALGRWPLLADEVPSALAAFRALSRGGTLADGYSPLLLGTQLGLFFLPVNPFTVRLVPALAGSLLVLLPYGARAWIGRAGALVVAALLALSPTWVYASRTADGAIVSLGLGMLALVLAGHALRGTEQHARAAVVCLALSLTAGPQIVGLLVSLAILLGWWLSFGPGVGSHTLQFFRQRWQRLRPRSLAALGVATWVVASTAALLNVAGIGASVDLLGDGFAALWVDPAGLPWYQNLVVLGTYESLALGLSLVGAFVAWRRRSTVDIALSVWLLIAVALVTVLGLREPRWVLIASLPSTLLAGRGAQHLLLGALSAPSRRDVIALAAGLCLTAFVYIQVTGYLQNSLTVYGVLALLGTGLLLSGLAGYGVWLEHAAGGRVALMLILVLATILTMRGTIALAYDRARDPWEPMLSHTSAATLPQFEAMLQHVSLTSAGDPRAVSIVYEESLGPGMAWLLRDYPNARSTIRAGTNTGATVLISMPRTDEVAPQGYVGQRVAWYAVRPHNVLSPARYAQWLLFRRPGPAVEYDTFWFWIKVNTESGIGG